MDEVTKRKILEAVLDEFKEAKLPSLEDAKRTIERSDELPMDLSVAAARTTLSLQQLIDEQFGRAPEPTGPELDKLLTTIKGSLRYTLRDAMLKMGKKMPHRPGGAPKKLDVQQSKRVLKLVADCIRLGDTHAQAVQKIALRFGVSGKTIHRELRARRNELKGSDRK